MSLNESAAFLLQGYSGGETKLVVKTDRDQAVMERQIRYTIELKMAARNFLPRCTAFFNRIPLKSFKIWNSKAMHLGKKLLAAIFSVIAYRNKAFLIFPVK